MASLVEHFHELLQDMYYAEKQIYKALPKMARKAENIELRKGLERHREQTEEQIARLEKVFKLIAKPVKGTKCPAIDGILEEGGELVAKHDPGAGLDAALASAAQAVEHYEIARYGTLCSWAEALSLPDVKTLLGSNLDEEEKTDKSLSRLALGRLNEAAVAVDEDEDDEANAPPARRQMKNNRKSRNMAA